MGNRRLNITLSVLVIGLTAFTALHLSPAFRVAFVNAPLDLVINTSITLVAGAVAALAWVRVRETGEALALFEAAAFLVLGSVNAVALALPALNLDDALGFTPSDPGPLPIVFFVAMRLVAVSLLLAGGYLALRGWQVPRAAAGWLVALPTAVTIVLLAYAVAGRWSVGPLLTPEAIEHIRTDAGARLATASVVPALVFVQLAIGALFLGAAALAYRLALGGARASDGYLAAGLILAGFSQVHFAAIPGSYVSLVSTGDGLLAGFYATMLAGIVVQSRGDLRTLRDRNTELAALRNAEVERALLEERGRLAREVHDGLAQDLWYARLKAGRLAQILDSDEPRGLAEDVMNAIDTGLADSRQAVMAMRASSSDAPLLDVLQDYVEDFGERFGLKVEVEAGHVPRLPTRVQGEILRVAQEALNNTRKHADATAVKVHASADDGVFRLSMSDNGRGFCPETLARGFGLTSMQERADLIGACLEIVSAPHEGTRVILSLPVPEGSGS